MKEELLLCMQWQGSMKVKNSSSILEEERYSVNQNERVKEEKETGLNGTVTKEESVGERIWNRVSQREHWNL